jgi:hypothetical protein
LSNVKEAAQTTEAFSVKRLFGFRELVTGFLLRLLHHPVSCMFDAPSATGGHAVNDEFSPALKKGIPRETKFYDIAPLVLWPP